MNGRTVDARWLHHTVAECVQAVHPWPSIDPDYARIRTEMILRTLSMESSLKWRRQNTIKDPCSLVGGNGIAQTEFETLKWMLGRLTRSPLLQERVRDWHFGDQENPYPLNWYQIFGAENLLWQARSDDRLSVLLCSLRYMFAPGIIPDGVDAQFEYWLKHYNGGGKLKHATRADALVEWRRKSARVVPPATDIKG